MAISTYTTDLLPFGASVTTTVGWTEPTGFAQTDAAGEIDTDLFIYGTSCYTEAQRKSGKGGLFYTDVQPAGWTAGDCVFVWHKFFAPTGVTSKALGGIQMLVGSTDADFNHYYVNGGDTYAYGGWINYVVDPLNGTPSITATGTPSGVINGVGVGCDLVAGIAKGQCHNHDIYRWGRGEVIVLNGDLANGYATFDALATVNDDPLTGRWGLFQKTGGSYLWKGLMSLGNVGTIVDFRDTGVTIAIDNTEYVGTDFNKIVLTNAGSNLVWDAISITATGTVARGQFIMADNASVTMTGCTFAEMDLFTFLGGANTPVIDSCIFKNLNQITTSLSTITGCTFESIADFVIGTTISGGSISTSEKLDLTVANAALSDVIVNGTNDLVSQVLTNTNGAEISACTFINSTADKHAIEIGDVTVDTSITWNHLLTTGDYTAGPGTTTLNYTPIANTNAAISVASIASGVTLTINAAGYNTNGVTPSVKVQGSNLGTIAVNLAANPLINVKVVDSAGTPLNGAFVYIHDGVSEIFNSTTNISGDITEISYGGGQASATLRVRFWGYYAYATTITTTADNSVTVTMSTDAQQDLTAPILTDVWTDVPVSKTLGWTSGTLNETIRDVYRFFANKYAATAFMQYEFPMKSVTATQYEFINGWTFTNATDYQHLKGGTVVDTLTLQTWANVTSIGSIQPNTSIYLVQNDAIVPSWWADGHIDILVETRNSVGTWLTTIDDNQLTIDGGMWFFARELGDLYASYFVDLSGGGRSTIPISTSEDRNNTTINTTIATYNDITFTFNPAGISRSLNGIDFFNYNVEIDLNGRPLSEFYEYTKYVTSLDFGAALLNGDNGYEYRNALETTYSGVDIATAPFGTFAGGRFFGAYGVFITNMAASDNINYELIDNTGVTRTPPITVSFELTGLRDNTEVRLHQTSDGAEVAGVELIVGGVATTPTAGVSTSGTTDDNTFVYTYTYSVDVSVYVVLINLEYEYLKIKDIILSTENQSIPVSQRQDRSYFNPV